MTEELKDVKVEEKKCNCECCMYLKKFVLITSSVFVGTTLAILVSASLLKPSVPPCAAPMFAPQPRMERPMHMRGFERHKFNHHGEFKGGKHHRPDFKKDQKGE